MGVPTALHFLGWFARPLQEAPQPSVETTRELPAASAEGPRAAALSERGRKCPAGLQHQDAAERPLLSAGKQSAFGLAQLLVQTMSLSFLEEGEITFAEEESCYSAGVGWRNGAWLHWSEGQDPTLAIQDTNPTWAMGYRRPS